MSGAKVLRFDAPQPKQEEFLRATQRFVAYGGARGGGKSWAVRVKAPLLALRYAGIRILLLRRTFPELRENHILPMRAMLKDVARYKESEKRFYFPNGSSIIFGYCSAESDVLQYQGQEYDVIFIDEATQFTEFQFSTLTACLRGANPFPKRMYLTCNPGGVGHAWVKRLFIDRDYRAGERAEDYVFIKALVDDNRALVEQDPDYVRMLDNLPTEELRRAWRYGQWDVFAGQYFTMWREDVHVIPPFAIPGGWRRYITLDYGLDMLAAYWIAVDEEGLAYVYHEEYRSGLIISEAAERIRAAGTDGVECVYAPPDLWNRRQDTGKSAADIFAECGVPLVKAQNNRVQGWYDMAEWLRIRNAGSCGGRAENRAGEKAGDSGRQRGIFHAAGTAGAAARSAAADGSYAALRIFRGRCNNLVRCLPQVQIDPKRINDVADEPHELTHSVDAIRYFCAGRPLPAEPAPQEDPFEPEQSELEEFWNYGA